MVLSTRVYFFYDFFWPSGGVCNLAGIGAKNLKFCEPAAGIPLFLTNNRICLFLFQNKQILLLVKIQIVGANSG